MAYSNMSALLYRFNNCFSFFCKFSQLRPQTVFMGASKLQQRQIFSFVLSLATGLAYGYIFREISRLIYILIFWRKKSNEQNIDWAREF